MAGYRRAYTVTATAMKTWKTNGVLLRNRQIHGELKVIQSSRKHVCGRHCRTSPLQTVTHPSINRAWRRGTTLIAASALVLRQTLPCVHVQVYVHERALQQHMIDIYREVVAHAVQWKCQKDHRVMPKSNSELYNNNLREVGL